MKTRRNTEFNMGNIRLKEADLQSHVLIIGEKISGKTEIISKPLLEQILKEKKSGEKLGITVIDSDGVLSEFANEYARCFNMDPLSIDATKTSQTYNILEGDTELVTKNVIAVLKNVFEIKRIFFMTIHEDLIMYTIKLLKCLHQDNINIFDISSVLKDTNLLQEKISIYRGMEGNTPLVHFFEDMLLVHTDKFTEMSALLIKEIALLGDDNQIRNILKEKRSFDLQSHVKDGGILTINTLGSAGGAALGTFILMELQDLLLNATNDTPHYIVLNNAGDFINDDTELFLKLAKQRYTSNIYITNNLKELEVSTESNSAIGTKLQILKRVKNKIVFGHSLNPKDARELVVLLDSGRAIVYKKNLFTTKEEVFLDEKTFCKMPPDAYLHQLEKNGVLQKVVLESN